MLNLGNLKVVLAKAPAIEGRVVYSTVGHTKPTILDAFKEQLLNPKIVDTNVAKLRKEATPQKAYAEDLLFKEAEKEGLSVFVLGAKKGESKAAYEMRLREAQDADVFISARVKGQSSSRDKIENNIVKMNNFEGPLDKKTQEKYDKSHKLINIFLEEIPLSEKYKRLIGDQLGLRYIQNRMTKNGKDVTDIITDNLKSLHQNNSGVSLRKIENYKGEGITPYTTSERVAALQKLKYLDEAGLENHVFYAQNIKPLGYTRINTDAKINGVKTEIQIGGNHTTLIGDTEHIFYDTRTNKKLDLSGYSPEQRALAKKIVKEYKKVSTDENATKVYNEYLLDMWKTARTAEESMINPIYKAVPEGIAPVLSADNVLSLKH